jgi:hypothetical protein
MNQSTDERSKTMATPATKQSFEDLAKGFLGKLVHVTNPKANLDADFRIDHLSPDLTGTMKNTQKAPYVVLVRQDHPSETMKLHPQAAKTLFDKGEDGGLRILNDVAGTNVEAAAVHEEPVIPSGELVEKIIESGGAPVMEANTQPDEPKVDETAQPEAAAAPAPANAAPATPKASQKEKAIAIYNEEHGKGGGRKETIARFKSELNMSAAGANTYYHNINNGPWKQK